mgnify:CR=1 FL=1
MVRITSASRCSTRRGPLSFIKRHWDSEECSIIHHTPTITSYFLSAPDHGLQLQLLHGVGLAADCAAYGHLGMRTEDIQASFALHSQMGCVSDKIVEQHHQFGYFIKDPDGYETEIVQLK